MTKTLFVEGSLSEFISKTIDLSRPIVNLYLSDNLLDHLLINSGKSVTHNNIQVLTIKSEYYLLIKENDLNLIVVMQTDKENYVRFHSGKKIILDTKAIPVKKAV
ncbi:MAG: hypothetical protein N2749_02530 [Clostridia bacterium]|nr:hypothetical protein [Clostridia bacterium]